MIGFVANTDYSWFAFLRDRAADIAVMHRNIQRLASQAPVRGVTWVQPHTPRSTS